ncbi:MAG: hypothetical protein IJC41_04210 [Firmicutes bacterium]|nr:hypothetical protein [Bacillota bacterium]MBR6700289.1 hypothetical protein [Bacillota bacterium]
MNNRDRSKSRSMPVTGISSLIVIFAVLCLTLLSVLAISTVKADERLEERSALAVKEFYEAEAEAEKILAEIRQKDIPGDKVYNYGCRINETQILEVEVKVSGTEYEIIKWQAVSDGEWDADESIKVWDGE